MTTNIEWTDETWNPVTGCTKVSQGCKNCYAERLWPRVEAAERKRNNGDEWRNATPRAFTDVNVNFDRLNAPLRWAKPRRVFVNSMSDLFHEDVGDLFILEVFDIMRQCANGWTHRLGGDKGKLVAAHTFQILTKRPQRMLDFCTRLRFAQNDGRGLYLAQQLPHNGFNPMTAMRNVWLGVSVEDQATADERIPLLLQTPAAVRFVSYEPALGPVDWTAFVPRFVPSGIEYGHGHTRTDVGRMSRGLDWIIAGGESGPHARPAHPDWFRSVRDQCAAAGVAFFFKQWGQWESVGPLYSDNDTEEHLEAIDTDPDQWSNECWITQNGQLWPPRDGQAPVGAWAMRGVGKGAAGRELDGRTHDEYPA